MALASTGAEEAAVGKTVIGLFEGAGQAQRVVQELARRGFAVDDISVIGRGEAERDETGAGGDRASGVAVGAGTGAALGGLGGLLVGVAALAVPGVGPVLAAGPLATALAGAGLGAAAGSVLGALADLGVPDEDAQVYAEGVRRGGVLVAVRAADERAGEAIGVMAQHRAVDVEAHAVVWRRAGWPGFDATAPPYTGTPLAGAPRPAEGKVGEPVPEPGVEGGMRDGAGRGVRAYASTAPPDRRERGAG